MKVEQQTLFEFGLNKAHLISSPSVNVPMECQIVLSNKNTGRAVFFDSLSLVSP